jgi:hypothetical protein
MDAPPALKPIPEATQYEGAVGTAAKAGAAKLEQTSRTRSQARGPPIFRE